MAKPTSTPETPRRRRLPWRKKGDGPGAITQMRRTYTIAHKHDRWILAYALGAFAGIVLVLVLLSTLLIGHVIIFTLVAVVVGVLVGGNVFAFRAQRAMYQEVADRPGVALEVVRRLRGDWKITEAVQFTRNQDFVHRVVCRAGVVLIGEGRPAAVQDLMANEARRTRRIASDAPLHEMIIGNRSSDVPLAVLRGKLLRLPRALKTGEVRTLDVKLKAVANTSLPLPKGPLPTRVPRGKQR